MYNIFVVACMLVSLLCHQQNYASRWDVQPLDMDLWMVTAPMHIPESNGTEKLEQHQGRKREREKMK